MIFAKVINEKLLIVKIVTISALNARIRLQNALHAIQLYSIELSQIMIAFV